MSQLYGVMLTSAPVYGQWALLTSPTFVSGDQKLFVAASNWALISNLPSANVSTILGPGTITIPSTGQYTITLNIMGGSTSTQPAYLNSWFIWTNAAGTLYAPRLNWIQTQFFPNPGNSTVSLPSFASTLCMNFTKGDVITPYLNPASVTNSNTPANSIIVGTFSGGQTVNGASGSFSTLSTTLSICKNVQG
jgi:hypothetical protein